MAYENRDRFEHHIRKGDHLYIVRWVDGSASLAIDAFSDYAANPDFNLDYTDTAEASLIILDHTLYK